LDIDQLLDRYCKWASTPTRTILEKEPENSMFELMQKEIMHSHKTGALNGPWAHYIEMVVHAGHLSDPRRN
jgi:hypothetical protein